jgi:hypothetical protein
VAALKHSMEKGRGGEGRIPSTARFKQKDLNLLRKQFLLFYTHSCRIKNSLIW